MNTLRLMRIFEILWLVAAAIALTECIIHAIKGESVGSYIYITLFTAGVAFVMYRVKKNHRHFLENIQRRKEEEFRKKQAEIEKAGKENTTP